MRMPAWPGRIATRMVPDSLGARLRLVLGRLTAVTLIVGWVGFSTLEDMHFRGHQLQLVARWQTTLDGATAALDAEALAHVRGESGEQAADLFEATFDALENTESYPGVVVDPAAIHAAYAKYDGAVDAVREAHPVARANAEDPRAQAQVRSTLGALRASIDADTTALLDTDDIAHHERLFIVLIAAGIAGFLGLWVGERTTARVTGPVRELGAHFLRVAHGQLEGRVRAQGPAEMRDLAAAVNNMTAQLERLSLERQMFEQQLQQASSALPEAA